MAREKAARAKAKVRITERVEVNGGRRGQSLPWRATTATGCTIRIDFARRRQEQEIKEVRNAISARDSGT